MMARLRGRRTEVLLAIVAVALIVLAGRGFVQERSSRLTAQDAEAQRIELEDEAALYDLDRLIEERDRLARGDGSSALPSYADAEFQISEIGRLIRQSNLDLGPFFRNELSTVVTNDDIGLASEVPEPRTYPAIELTLQLNGDVRGLLDLAELLLTDVSGATFHDLVVEQDPVARTASLSVRVLFFHQPTQAS